MTATPIAVRSNTARYSFAGSTKLVNMYAESLGPDAKSPLAAFGCYGSELFASVTDSPCRGMIYMPDLDLIYSVHENSIYKVASDGTATRVGVIPGIDIVEIARNGKLTPQIVIKTASAAWFVEGETIYKVTDPDLPSPVVSVAEIDGYIIYGIADGRFFWSAIDECSDINALNFATAEQSPDGLVRVFNIGSDLLLFGGQTVEIWRDTGTDVNQPFQPMPVTLSHGLLAAESVALVGSTVCYAATNFSVYQVAGYAPTIISTPEVERLIEDDPNQADIIGFSWESGKHQYYLLTGTDWSKCYDTSIGAWHDRESYGSTRWRHRFAVNAFGGTIVGDSKSGNLYRLKRELYTEAGGVMVSRMRPPSMQAFPNGAIVDALAIDMAVGGAPLGQDAKLMLSWSDDGGHSFTGNRQLSLGRRGKYATRLRPRRMGRFGPQGRVYDLSISDPVPRAIALIDATVRPLVK